MSAALRMLGPVACLLAMSTAGSRASAQDASPAVLVLAGPGESVSTELVGTLRIHLPGVRVRSGAAAISGDLADDLDVAGEALEADGASLAIWIRRTDTPGAALLHVVGRRHDIALIRVVEIEGAPGSDLDRALAMTVAELLDEVLAMTRPRRGAAEQPRLELATALAVPERPNVAGWALAAEIGAAGAIGTGTQVATVGPRFAAFARHTDARATFELGAALVVPSTSGASRDGARVSVDALEPALELRALARLDGTWSLGAAATVGLRALRAHASAADGRAGQGDALVAVVSLAPEARVVAFPGLEVRCAMGVELATERRAFAVQGTRVLDLGWARPLAILSIVLVVP